MATLESSIRLNDEMSDVLFKIIGAVDSTISAVDRINSALASGADTSSFEEMSESIANVREQIRKLTEMELPAPEWQSDTGIEVFNTSGIERWRQEASSLNSMMDALRINQETITQNAIYGNVLPPNAAADMININERIGAIQQRIQQINANPANAVSPAASAEAEQLRGQLNDMLQTQQRMNAAVENMDVAGANQEYLRLSGSVSNTERYIRDNVDEQGRFNHAVEQGTSSADKLMNALKGAISIYAVIKGVKKSLEFASDCSEKFNTQLNAENQLMAVLGNMLTTDYVSEFKIQTTADTSGAVSDIQTIASDVDAVDVAINVDKTAAANALQSEFDQIKAKASEIQGNGIYGDEAMIAGAAEFATYFTDVDAITTMMDTLSNYAMGMSGGGEIDSDAMVNYATGLGKIMSGSYEAMTKKGFEFSDAQKAVIEGTAEEAQYVEVLGEGWRDMSADMRSAAAITQVIDEGWGGLYEKMSNTPEGQIIQLSNAWGDMQETIGQQMYPVILGVVELISNNWNVIQGVVDGAVEGITIIIGILEWVISIIVSIADFVQQNWDIIQPILMGIVSALGVVAAAWLGYKVAMGVAAVAQNLFNGTLFKCPLVWVAAAVGAVVAALGIFINKMNKAYGLNLSFAGMLSGCVMVILAACGNLIIMLVNFFLLLGNIGCGVWEMLKAAFYNVYVFFNNAICDIQAWFWGLLSTVLTVVAKVGDALNKIPFVNIDTTGIKDKAAEFTEKEAEATGNKLEYEDAGAAFLKGMDTIDYLDTIDYNDAFEMGYDWGANVFGGSDTADDQADFMPDADDYLNTLNDIDDNTDDIKNGLEITDEELKYLRDIAEKEAINRFTTAEISVSMGGVTNNVSSDTDLDGTVDYLARSVQTAMEECAEGVYA